MPSKDSMRYADDAGGEDLLGWRVKVYWGGDKRWYEGVVNKYNPEMNQHHILYDDGDRKWHTLSHENEVRCSPPPPIARDLIHMRIRVPRRNRSTGRSLTRKAADPARKRRPRDLRQGPGPPRR